MKKLSDYIWKLRYLYRWNPVSRYIRGKKEYKDLMKDPHSRASLEVWDMIPRDQRKEVFTGTASAEIMPEYLGDILTYKYLAELIPLDWTVVDLGCSYNAQSFLFQKHVRHIAVDFGKDYSHIDENGKWQCTGEHWKVKRFKAPTCEYVDMKIHEFVESDTYKELDLDTTFAICNWVPPWFADNMRLASENFRNVYVRYPASVKEN